MSDGNIYQGQQYDQQNDNVNLFTQEMCDIETAVAAIGNPGTEITPHDRGSEIKRVWDITASQAALLAQDPYISAGTTKFNLPSVLVSLTVAYNHNEGDGDSSGVSAGVTSGTTAAASQSIKLSSQASAAIMPELSFSIQDYWADSVPCVSLEFYMPRSFSQADLITRLETIVGGTVLPWPAWRPEALTIALTGQQMDVSKSVEISQSLSLTASSLSQTISIADGHNQSKGLTNKSVSIPSTLHGSFSLTASDTASATASASITGSTGGGSWTAQTSAGGKAETVTGTVSPSSISATSPDAVPTSGIYIHTASAQKAEFGLQFVQVELVDFAYFS